jgi:hypothetical protein
VPYPVETTTFTNQRALPGALAEVDRHDHEPALYLDALPPGRQTWAGIAAAYATYTSPLRPSREDLGIVEQAAREWEETIPIAQ